MQRISVPVGIAPMTVPATEGAFALLLGATAEHQRTIEAQIASLQAARGLREVHLPVVSDDVSVMRKMVGHNEWDDFVNVEAVSATRDLTIYDGLTAIQPNAASEDLVLIAEVDRLTLTEPIVTGCLSQAATRGASILATQIEDDVILASETGMIAIVPPEGWTFVAAGLLVAQFSLVFDLYEWASTVAGSSIGSPYRWSLRQLGAVVVVADNDAVRPAVDVMFRK